MAEKLAKLADLKAYLGQAGTGNDTLLTALLVRATSLAEVPAGRPLMRRTAITELPHRHLPHQRYCTLDRFPIESVASVKQAYAVTTDAGFEAIDTLAENVDYVVDGEWGKLERINSAWYLQRRWLQVIYSGGYIDPDTEEIPAAAVLPPESLQQGLIAQAAAWFNRGSKEGLKNAGGGDKQGATQLSDPQIHPELVAAATALRRYSV